MTRKNWMGSAAAGLAAICLTAGAAWYTLSPSGYVALDVNPSIELEVNRLGKVVAIHPVNADAKELLKDYKPTDRDLDDVVEDLVDRMAAQGYLGQDKKNEVLITASEEGVSQQALERVNQRVETYLAERELAAQLYNQRMPVEEPLRQEAQDHQVSAGKMALIDKLLAGDPSLNASQLAEMRISDLMDYAWEHNIPLDQLEERLDTIEDRYDHTNGAVAGQVDRLEEELDRIEDQYDRDDDDHDDLDDKWDDRDDDDDYDDAHDDWDDDLDDRDDDDRDDMDDDWDDDDDRDDIDDRDDDDDDHDDDWDD